MSDMKEKIKGFLLLSDEDVVFLYDGNFKGLLNRNKEACVRMGILYGCVLIAVLLYLSLFSVLGAFGKLVSAGLFFGSVALAGWMRRKDLATLSEYPVFSYSVTGIFFLIALSLLSDISSQGSFLSVFLALLILGGIVGGFYTLRRPAAEFGISTVQGIGLALAACSVLFSLQMAGIQFVTDQEISTAQRRSEARRHRDAEQMRNNQASMKVCASEEECRKMHMKKNTYYAQYEEISQELCESAVAKEITGRFEWTVSAKDYKFDRYEVDILKDEIILSGNRARLIGGNGVKTNISYTCRYNTKRKTCQASVQRE